MAQSIADLQFDEINRKYFETLLKFHSRNKKEPLIIGENVSFALDNLPIHSYKDLKKKEATYLKTAKEVSLWLKKAQGGGGTSIKRNDYLQKLKKSGLLGSKGTDLFVSLGKKTADPVSLAEIQVLQALESIVAGEFGEIFFDDIVSIESLRAVKEMWNKNSWIDKTLRYEQLPDKYKNFHKFKETIQSAIPTLNDKGELTTKRMAPGGHAFFAFEALLSAIESKSLPSAKFENLVSVIGNGEDLGSTPDGIIIGWMVEEKIPITMITTEKTEIDLKGGQIACKKNADGMTTVTIIEQAQAKETGKLELFQKNNGLFNTNVAIFNYRVLVPKLLQLRDKLGHENFQDALAPTLIKNKKAQKDEDGEVHYYEQLEGAMGSTLLNLDAAYRTAFGESLVAFVNIERQSRTRFFSPVKTAFDFFLLFHSDRFTLNAKTFRLVDHRPGALPLVSLNAEYYEEVQNVLDAFKNTQVLDLDELRIEGAPVTLNDLILIGRINIINSADHLFDLGPELKKKGIKELKNQSVRITPQGTLIIS